MVDSEVPTETLVLWKEESKCLEACQLSSCHRNIRATSLPVSYCHSQLFRATHSLREDFSLRAISVSQRQASTVAANESSSPSSPPLEAHTPSKMSETKWKHAFPRLDLQTERNSTILHQEADPQSRLDPVWGLRRRAAKETKVTLSTVPSDRAPPTSEIKPCLSQRK